MKSFKKTGILIVIAALLTALFPMTALAGVVDDEGGYGSDGNATMVYSELTGLTSSDPSALYPWTAPPPTVAYTATLSAAPGYSLALSITVERVSYDDSVGIPPFPVIVEETYLSGTDYTYHASTGEIVIPVETLEDIAYFESPYDIRITASGVPVTTSYSIAVTQGVNGTIGPAVAENILHGSDVAFTITPDAGFRIADVLADGQSVGTVNSYTFTNVTSDHTITALFGQKSEPQFPSETQSPSATQPPADDSPDIPKTGDIRSAWGWWLWCGLGIAGIVTLSALRLNRKRR